MAHDVFISYSFNNQKIVEGLSAYLEQNGIRCFVAYRDIPRGKNWAEYIPPAIENCKMMVYVHSTTANKSEMINNEIALCLKYKHPILPFKIQDIDYVGEKAFHLIRLNWIDAFPNPNDYFLELLTSIKNLFPNLEIEIKQRKEKQEKLEQARLEREKLEEEMRLQEEQKSIEEEKKRIDKEEADKKIIKRETEQLRKQHENDYHKTNKEMYLFGSFTNWQARKMSKRTDGKWEVEINFISKGLKEFKFANTSDWSGTDWGEKATVDYVKIIEPNAKKNIFTICEWSGKYLFIFDDNSLNYEVISTSSTLWHIGIFLLKVLLCAIIPIALILIVCSLLIEYETLCLILILVSLGISYFILKRIWEKL